MLHPELETLPERYANWSPEQQRRRDFWLDLLASPDHAPQQIRQRRLMVDPVIVIDQKRVDFGVTR